MVELAREGFVPEGPNLSIFAIQTLHQISVNLAKVDRVGLLVADSPHANITTDTDRHPSRYGQPIFVGHIDNRRSWITRQNPPICNPHFT